MASVTFTVLGVCLALILVVLFKPSITIKKHEISIYWAVVLVGAVLMVIFGFLSPSEILSGLTEDSAINPLKILVLFISMTELSIFLDEVGLFSALAVMAVQRAKTSQRSLFFYLFAMVSILTVFTSNDIIILTFTPFICYFSKNAKINPIPYLFTEFVAANTWSMMFIIGNPTNIYLATSASIGFGGYFAIMWLPTFFAGLCALGILYLIFRKDLDAPMKASVSTVRINDPFLLLLGLIHLTGCTICLVISSYIGLEMYKVTFGFFLSLCFFVIVHQTIHKHSNHEMLRTIKRAPFELIPFVLSMFVLVLALDKYHVTDSIANLLGSKQVILRYGLSSFLTANVINNIPMSVLFCSVCDNLDKALMSKGLFASIIGSNIGAFFTPLGALAGIMWSSILKKHEVKFSFLTYIRYGVVISVPVLLTALFGLFIRFLF